MKGKLALLVGAGAGYVLGSRAGRARYEQIRSGARRMWEDPRIQHKKQEATSAVKDAVREQGAAAKDKIQEKVHSHSHSGSQSGSHSGSPAGSPGDTGGVGSAGADRAGPTRPGSSWPA